MRYGYRGVFVLLAVLLSGAEGFAQTGSASGDRSGGSDEELRRTVRDLVLRVSALEEELRKERAARAGASSVAVTAESGLRSGAEGVPDSAASGSAASGSAAVAVSPIGERSGEKATAEASGRVALMKAPPATGVTSAENAPDGATAASGTSAPGIPTTGSSICKWPNLGGE